MCYGTWPKKPRKVESIEELLTEYAKGQRHFSKCELDECDFQDKQLKEIIFEKCFLSSDFSGANLEAAQFLNCNIKCAVFTNANLKAAIIKNCSVEGIDMKGTNVAGIIFEQNWFHGNVVELTDFLD